MGWVEDWRTMSQVELTAVVRQIARECRSDVILQRSDEVVEGDGVDTVDEDHTTLNLTGRQRVVAESESREFPRFRLIKRRSTAGFQVLLLRVKPGPARDWRTLSAVRVSKRARVIDEDEP